ncbi:sigma factor [Micromonospora sp. NPDC047134]|uniref:sigma factor n=1 Tax=Micromonospora sp. NPDC047134 TaxID=3154340 RepID=UPI003400FFA5
MGSVESRPKLTRTQVEQIEQLYLLEAEDLHRYAHSRSWVRACDAQDLVQITFHEAVGAWEKVEPLGSDERRRWLRQVLRNKAVDLWRVAEAGRSGRRCPRPAPAVRQRDGRARGADDRPDQLLEVDRTDATTSADDRVPGLG